MSELVLLSHSEGVATLTLNRPDKLNAFGDDMRGKLAEALDRVRDTPGIGVLVITGAGRAFSAGGDIQHMVRLKDRDAPYEDFSPLLEAGREGILRLVALPMPVIAAINGPAAGGGLNLALACDLRIASDQATLGETFVRIGLHADWGGTYFLPRLVGTAKALELCWLGEMIDASEALRIGLVNKVVPHGRFAEEIAGWARRLVAAPRTSITWVKRTLRASWVRSLEECLADEIEAQRACWASPDSAEGVRAFVEKRAPVYGREPARAVAAPSAAARRFE